MNIIRSTILQMPCIKTFIGAYYATCHSILVHLIIFVLLFSSDIIYLSCIFNLLAVDAISIVILHDCPLTILEQKYLKSSMAKIRNKVFKKAKIAFKCNHQYESSLEAVLNLLTLIGIKIGYVIMLKMYNLYKTGHLCIN
jgi:hypothetical protein